MLKRNLLYIIAALIVGFWMVGFLIYSVGAIIHTLLIVAFFMILFKAIKKKKNLPPHHSQSIKSSEKNNIEVPH